MPVRYRVRGLDIKYLKRFDKVYSDAGVSVEPTASRALNQNAFVECWIGSKRHECLNRFIAFGLSHLDHIVSCYCEYYHHARPHQRMITSHSSAYGPRSMIRPRAVRRSSAESGSVACLSTTNAEPPSQLSNNLRLRYVGKLSLSRALARAQNCFVRIDQVWNHIN